ncbi:MAG TPA: PilZ domain-containing protein [Terriglobales bacterium]|jgi:hypothetical protein|nr:PilZ domain-containing protein [Terriglobales bacterium]
MAVGTDVIQQDRRRAPRRRVLKAGKILINEGESVFDCTLRDISASGARFSLGLFQALPKRFQIAMNDLGEHYCELVRITGNEYGVRFLDVAVTNVAA